MKKSGSRMTLSKEDIEAIRDVQSFSKKPSKEFSRIPEIEKSMREDFFDEIEDSRKYLEYSFILVKMGKKLLSTMFKNMSLDERRHAFNIKKTLKEEIPEAHIKHFEYNKENLEIDIKNEDKTSQKYKMYSKIFEKEGKLGLSRTFASMSNDEKRHGDQIMNRALNDIHKTEQKTMIKTGGKITPAAVWRKVGRVRRNNSKKKE